MVAAVPPSLGPSLDGIKPACPQSCTANLSAVVPTTFLAPFLSKHCFGTLRNIIPSSTGAAKAVGVCYPAGLPEGLEKLEPCNS